jgi:hydroxylaminobenzene mutase
MTTTLESGRAQVALHGLIVLLIGLLAGIGFSYAATTAPVGSDLYKNWHFAHMEGLFNGVVVLAIAGIWPAIAAEKRAVRLGKWLLVLGAYANAIGPWITALFIGHRVIQPHTPMENLVVYGFYIPGVLPLFAVAIFVWSAFLNRRRVATAPTAP